MPLLLDKNEVRVLGALIEKEITTPAYYPLSLNALTAACNQTSNRYPVMHLSDSDVISAADNLREKGLVHLVDRGESRVTKYRHVLYEALNLGRQAVAVICVLMLRGPQTIGEIRGRSNRLYDFASIEDVETTLRALMTGEVQLITCLERQPGQKEARYAHLLSGPVENADLSNEGGEPELDRIARLERDVEDLKAQFAEFRKQFE